MGFMERDAYRLERYSSADRGGLSALLGSVR